MLKSLRRTKSLPAKASKPDFPSDFNDQVGSLGGLASIMAEDNVSDNSSHDTRMSLDASSFYSEEKRTSKINDGATFGNSSILAPKKHCGAFEKLGLEQRLVHAVKRLGFNLPTPIQRKTIPSVLCGRDVVAMARTGSGKTAAFVLPILQKLATHKNIMGIRAVILEPTRELALQVEKVVRQLGRYTDLRIMSIVGGRSMETQFTCLARNPDIVVACPGRLMHHIVEASLKLITVEILVLDEADQMFELGLGEQVDKILQNTSPTRQCILTSATLPSQLIDFASVGLRSPHFIRLDVEKTFSPDLNMWFLYTRRDEKLAALIFLLHDVFLKKDFSYRYACIANTVELPQGILVFAASRHHVDFLGCLLRHARIVVDVVYGSMDLQARVEAVTRFRQGKSKVLIVTDVAARGLDLPIVGCVINFDFPLSPKHFIHRVGRTARAGRAGLAVSFVERDELPNAVEVLLFAGADSLNLPSEDTNTSSVQQFPTLTNSRKSVLGGLPNLASCLEFVRETLGEDCELRNMYRTMLNAGIQYRKTRRVASRQSIRRAKTLFKGDAFSTVHVIHPMLLACLPQVSETYSKIEEERSEFLKKLHAIKPRTTAKLQKGGRHGGVLQPLIVEKMEKRQFFNNLGNFSLQVNNVEHRESESLEGSSDELVISISSIKEPSIRDSVVTRLPDPVSAEGVTHETKGRLRISAAERRELKKLKQRKGPISSKTNNTDFHCISDRRKPKRWKNDGIDIFDWKAQALQNPKNFFLSNEKSSTVSFHNFSESTGTQKRTHSFDEVNGLQEMEKAQFNLIPEDTQTQRHQMKTVRKWNAHRKRYMLTQVDALSGKVLRAKQIKQRNEAGVIYRGELNKTGAYEKWMKSTRSSIPHVGEVEKEQPKWSRRTKHVSKENTCEEITDASKVPLHKLTKDKALIEAIQSDQPLTRKQQRKAKRILVAQRGVVQKPPPGRGKSELKNFAQITKAKREEMKKKAKHNVRFREELRKLRTEEHMKKRRYQNESRAASRRSFVLVRNRPAKRSRGS